MSSDANKPEGGTGASAPGNGDEDAFPALQDFHAFSSSEPSSPMEEDPMIGADFPPDSSFSAGTMDPSSSLSESTPETIEEFKTLDELSGEGADTTDTTTEEPTVPLSPSPSGAETLEQVREFGENLPVGNLTVQAAYPFSLLITGPLSTEEKEKLLDLLSRENFGIREVDLEPQLASGKVLIPRISEYAGILLVQALRGSRAELKLAPSDSIFATPDTQSSAEDTLLLGRPGSTPAPVTHPPLSKAHPAPATGSEIAHPAESLPITPGEKLPGLPEDHIVVIDTVSASATLKTTAVEAERSTEYLEILEALQRELKYKAYRKGARAVLNFKVTLAQMTLRSHYRLTALGTAVRPRTDDYVQLGPEP